MVTANIGLAPEEACRLVFVRHGTTDWNVAGRFRGRADVPLNWVGRRDTARAVAELHQGLSLHVREELVDLDFGDWTGKRLDEVAARRHRCLSVGAGLSSIRKFRQDNACVHVIDLHDSYADLLRMNDTTHLQDRS